MNTALEAICAKLPVEAEEVVQKVIHSRWLTMGVITQEFERQFAALCGVKFASGAANGAVVLPLYLDLCDENVQYGVSYVRAALTLAQSRSDRLAGA